jgi:hypothetical protein
MLSDVFLAGTVVAGSATLWIWLKERKLHRKEDESKPSLRAGPMVTRHGGAGFTLGGRF